MIAGSIAAFFLACTSSEQRTAMPTERDSAGIRIVETVRDEVPSEAAWSLAPVPFLVIGQDDADPMQQLHRVNAAGRLADGRIVIVHGLEPYVRWYDATGRFLMGAGREGSGPGDYPGNEAWIGMRLWVLPGDSCVIWLPGINRVYVYGPNAQLNRQFTLDRPFQPQHLMVGRMGDGFVMSRGPVLEAGDVGAVRRAWVEYVMFRGDGTRTGSSIPLPGHELYTREFAYPPETLPAHLRGRGPIPIRSEEAVPFGKKPVATAAGDRLYYGSGDQYEIAVYDSSGSLRAVSRLRNVEPREVTRELLATIAGAPLVPPDAPLPDYLPAFEEFIVDRTGMLWVRGFDLPGAGMSRFDVFDESLHWTTSLELPREWVIKEIGRDYIVVVERNDLDVQTVRLYRLVRR